MSKRNDTFEKRGRDYYPTPFEAVLPIREDLLESFGEDFMFCEPCAADGRLANHIEKLVPSFCVFAMDIEPQVDWVLKGDSSQLSLSDMAQVDAIITNPPFTWSILRPMLDHWLPVTPTVLLLPADFMHNLRFQPYLKRCEKIVSIGRVKWIEDSKMSGMDNYCWYFFNPEETGSPVFKGRK